MMSEPGKGMAIVIGGGFGGEIRCGISQSLHIPNNDNTQGFWSLYSNRQGTLNIGCTAGTRHE
jgi:fluoride ion exporter CrcB/FEX